MNFPIDLTDLAKAAMVAVLGAMLTAALVARFLRHRKHSVRPMLTDVHAELRAVTATVVALSARFDRLIQLLDTDARHSTTAAPNTRAGRGGYELAVRLAQAGARPEEIMAACAMHRREADLILRLHAGPGTDEKRLSLVGAR